MKDRKPKRKPSVYATMVNELRVTQGALAALHEVLTAIADRLRGSRLDVADAATAMSRLSDGVQRLDQAVRAMPETLQVELAEAIQVEVANVCPECQNERWEPTEPFSEFLPGDQAEAKKAA